MKLSEGVHCGAEELHGQYIGEIIRFNWTFPHSQIYAVVTGELRQISHVEGHVHVNLTGHLGNGTDLTEFDLEPGQDVQFMYREGRAV